MIVGVTPFAEGLDDDLGMVGILALSIDGCDAAVERVATVLGANKNLNTHRLSSLSHVSMVVGKMSSEQVLKDLHEALLWSTIL